MPSGRVIYADTQRWRSVEKPFYDHKLGLTGKPDYLVKRKDLIIPVEVKSSRMSTAPFDAHIYQLATYCLLVHHHFGVRPSYGILHYPNRTFAVDYTQQLEATLLNLLQEMRTLDRRKDVMRSHDSVARCSRCGFRTICNQELM